MLPILASIFSTISNFLSNIAIVLFLHCFYDAKFLLPRKKIYLFLAIEMISFLVDLFFPVIYASDLFFLFILILYIYTAVYDYSGKKILAIWRFFIYSILLVFFFMSYATLIDACLFNNWYSSPTVSEFSPESNLISGLIGTGFFGFTAFFLYRQYRKGVIVRCGKREIWVLCVAIFLTSFACSVVSYSGNNAYAMRWIVASFSLLWAFVFPTLLYSTRISEYYRNRSATQEQHMQAELDHFQQYRLTQEENARFHHDIRNNLLCLNNMMQEGRIEEATLYLKDLVKAVDRPSKKYITGDALLDGIVAAKVQQMEQHGISFRLDGVLAGGLPWKPMDICNVFANALDNAIEACQSNRKDNQTISMQIKSTPQFWFVTIENPVNKKINTAKLFQKNSGYTSKVDKARHGIGTYNMKYTVDSYGDMLSAQCTDDTFTLEIMVDKKQTEC